MPKSPIFDSRRKSGGVWGCSHQFRPPPRFARDCSRARGRKTKKQKKLQKKQIIPYHIFSMKTESDATAIPRFEDEHKAFIKDRLLHRVPYWQIVDLFIATYPDFQPPGVSWNDYRNRIYQRIAKSAQRDEDIKAAHAAQDEQIAKIAHTDKYLQLATLTNYIERDWQPRTFAKTATDMDGNEYPIYKDNIGQLIQCYNMINKLSDELNLVQSGKGTQPTSGPPKPVDPVIAAARKAGAPGPGDQVPTNEFPSFAGPPPKEEEDVSPVLSNPKTIVKI